MNSWSILSDEKAKATFDGVKQSKRSVGNNAHKNLTQRSFIYNYKSYIVINILRHTKLYINKRPIKLFKETSKRYLLYTEWNMKKMQY